VTLLPPFDLWEVVGAGSPRPMLNGGREGGHWTRMQKGS
jgi:hypothetical protein